MTPDPSTPPAHSGASTRTILQTIARVIATDRRPSLLANANGKVMLANKPAQRINLDQKLLLESLDWTTLCKQALRAGSTAASISNSSMELEGEVVHLSFGDRDGYLLRLAENDHEASWLRNRARSATLLRVAHDLRTPIQSLLATAENVLDDEGNTNGAEREQVRKQLLQASEMALDHINNVLGVIRGDQNLTGIRPDETFNITEELRTLLMMIGPIARKRDVDLKLWLDPHEDTWVVGPVQFVRALLQNVIDNSAKYGGAEVEIGLTCRPLPPSEDEDEDDWLKITLTVKDLGGGLPQEQKSRLFAALGHSPNADKHQGPQTQRPSAGLNVLAHALRQLGGKLELFDRFEKDDAGDDVPEHVIGTEIKVTLPLQKGKKPDPLYDLENAQAPMEAPLNGFSIILVEDSPSSRDWIVHMLRTAGAHVWAAGNGVEALSLLARPNIKDQLDLILTDMTLPYMSGVELAQRIRKSDQTPWNGPIIALTAHVADEIVAACHSAGIAKVLEKPIRSSQLRDAILDVLDPPRQPNDLAPAAQNPAVKTEACESMLNDYIVNDLLSQLGKEGAVTFMTRALNEATAVLARIRDEGVGPDTGRMLHAATGACSLTGLSAVESCLRSMERAFDTGTSLEPSKEGLETALAGTSQAIASIA